MRTLRNRSTITATALATVAAVTVFATGTVPLPVAEPIPEAAPAGPQKISCPAICREEAVFRYDTLAIAEIDGVTELVRIPLH